MMMIPRRNHEFDLLGEMFRDPFFTEGESKVMKTDIKEKKDKTKKRCMAPRKASEKSDICVERARIVACI